MYYIGKSKIGPTLISSFSCSINCSMENISLSDSSLEIESSKCERSARDRATNTTNLQCQLELVFNVRFRCYVGQEIATSLSDRRFLSSVSVNAAHGAHLS